MTNELQPVFSRQAQSIEPIEYFDGTATHYLDKPITACGSITEAGNYYLANGVSTDASCIFINAENVFLYCQDKQISGFGTDGGVGITINADFARVDHCATSFFETGIKLNAKNAFLLLNRASNAKQGVFIDGVAGASNNVVANTSISDAFYGILVVRSSNNWLPANKISSVEIGVELRESS